MITVFLRDFFNNLKCNIFNNRIFNNSLIKKIPEVFNNNRLWENRVICIFLGTQPCEQKLSSVLGMSRIALGFCLSRIWQTLKKFGCQTQTPFMLMGAKSVNLNMTIFWADRQGGVKK